MNISETFSMVLTAWNEYNGTGWYCYFFAAALIYLLVYPKEKRMRAVMGEYSLLVLFFLFFPVTAWVLDKCVSGSYWRCFWLLPIPFLVSYSCTRLIEKISRKVLQYLAAIVLVLILAVGGTQVFISANYTERDNLVKIDSEAVNMTAAIERDASNRGITYKKVAVTEDLLCTIREYDASILMPYGRSPLKNEPIGENEQKLFDDLEAENKDWNEIDELIRGFDCNYFIYYVDERARAILEGMGYEMICIGDGHYLYRVPEEAEEQNVDGPEVLSEGEFLITQYPGTTGSNSMFYTIQDAAGHLIVVDGGWTGDADYVRGVIEQQGGTVDLWILTHAHQDHAGAFNEIYSNPGDITILQVLASPLTYEDTRSCVLDWEEYGTLQNFESVTQNADNLTFAEEGQVISWNGLTIQILSCYWPGITEYTSDLLNDGSIMFKITGTAQSMLFCADVGASMSEHILSEWGDTLDVDYVQMGHHGNGGLTEEFYRETSPLAAFFDAPRWLMENINPADGTASVYTTPDRVAWMQSMGAQVISFMTGVNQIILR